MKTRGRSRSVEEIEREEELRRRESVGVLNIQLLAIRLPLYSSSFSKCEEGKQYH